MKDINEATASDLAQTFVNMARSEAMRVGHRNGGTQGTGATPYDTGALQNSIRIVRGGSDMATVVIGNSQLNYPGILEFMATLRNGKPNLHRNFVEKLILDFYPQYIASEYGVKVSIAVVGGNQ